MPPNSAYYDTCVFAESLNSTHFEYAACNRLLAVERISWSIAYCAELTFAEATIIEFVQNFEIACASNGITIQRIKVSEAKATAKRNLGLKKRLSLMGFVGKDWTHLMAALHSAVECLCTVDPDFWDPANKATPHAAVPSIAVQQEIEDELPILIVKPSEFLAS